MPGSTTWRIFIVPNERHLNRAMPLAAVLLDLDGTLLDTAPDMARVANQLRTQSELAPLPFADIRHHVSHGSAAVLRAVFPGLDGVRLAALQIRFLELYREQLVIDTRLFPGFDDVLAALEANRIPWGVITNKPGWLTEPLLAHLGLYERAACVLSGDSLPVSKPDPLPLLTAAHRIAVAPERCVYVGDALRDMQAARAAGMVGLAARYGYIGPAEHTADWPVTAWIDSPLELLDWVGLPRAALAVPAGADG
jgi:phosphoglycolate phosphatase